MQSFSARLFRYESEMAEPVLKWLNQNGLAAKTEFHTPCGICDIVGVKFRPSRVRVRLSYGQKYAVGPALRLHVLNEIPDRESGTSVTFHRLHTESFSSLPPARLQRELEHLKRRKFIASTRRGTYHKLNGWAPLHDRIVAVELKLAKISEAVFQARSNLSFATESYIALPIDRARRIARLPLGSAIKKRGIGLLGVSRTKCERLFVGSRATQVWDEILRAHCVERFWRTRDSSP